MERGKIGISPRGAFEGEQHRKEMCDVVRKFNGSDT